ncbi:Cytochrome P450 monooxygenase lepH [Cladobotryum mycophilum]|uniref:Cytochrome P450 monooxygenase lepH n=1 Tax=Cladobotryum mycophilum TaxID=491253 RepID=A0ABR0SH03_9HYPO
MEISTYIFLFVGVSIFYNVCARFLGSLRYERKRKALGCGEIKKYSHKDPIFGLDLVSDMAKSFKEHRWLPWQKELFESHNAKTLDTVFLGTRTILSMDSENMKAMSTDRWEEFGVQPIRFQNGAVTPFATQPGVSLADGELWHYSRNMIKPYFDRSGFRNLNRLDESTDRLVSLLPMDGTTVDMQPLMQRWFLDTSSTFVFGKNSNSLTYPEKVAPATAMVEVMRGLRARLQMGRLNFLYRDKLWFDSIAVVHNYLDENIASTLAQIAEIEKSGKEPTDERADLLWDMAKQLREPELLRGQLLAVWIPSNDTTSILVSNAFYALARNPRVFDKLRAEVLAINDTNMTFEDLRGIKYMNYVINETHRLYPNGIEMVRVALKDTTLPVGGGPDEKQPIFIRKGDIVKCNRYTMHRDPDVWGDDAEEFKPERWETARPMWKFVPFGGGPRICPAHVLVATEAAYVIFRVLQRVKAIEPRDSGPYVAVMRAGPSNKNGVKVAFTAA